MDQAAASADSVTTSTAPETPAEILTPQDATAERIAKTLSPENAAKFRKARAEKKAKAQAAPAVETPTPAAAAEPAPAAAAETASTADEKPTEVLQMGEEEAPATAETTEEVPELTADELAKLDEKARKRITEASKEAAKVRKRAQEAEAKAKELETKLAEIEQQAADGATRQIGLAGNAFAQFTDGHQVSAWGTNAQEALVLIRQHQKEVKAGRRDESHAILHTLPNGQEVELSVADEAAYAARVEHAQKWFEHDAAMSKHRESAGKLAEKHKSMKGYEEARQNYLKDSTALPARIEELVAKAALYDVLQSRRATITFPDTAGAANNASSTKAKESETAPRKAPPSETPASTPRLARTGDAVSDVQARKSQLMQLARTAKTEDERQKFLKQAIKLGPVKRAA